jgi:hypothetical protein
MNGRTRLAAFLITGSLAACGSNGAMTSDPNAIVIGALADSTGASATTLYATAINLAASQMNQAMAAAKSNIRFNVRVVDSQSDPMHSQAAVADLINNERIKGVVTDISGDTVAVNMLNYDGNFSAGYQVPVTCYLCSSAFINNPDSVDADMVRQNAMRDGEGWLFRTFFNAKYEAAVQTRIALNRGDQGDVNGDGVFKVGVYASDDAYGQSSAAAVKDVVGQLRAGKSAVEVLFQPPKVDANSYDWGGALATLLDDRNEETKEVDGKPDAIFITLLSLGATAAAKAYHEAAYTTPLQATTAFRRNYILRSLTSAAEGIEGNSPRLVADDESGSAFKNAFEIASSGEPTEMGCSGAYDSTIALMLAAVKASIDLPNPSDVPASEVRAALAQITDPEGTVIHATVDDFARAYQVLRDGGTVSYRGASGATNYDPAGDAHPALVHWKVQQQRFIESEGYDCESDPLCTETP